MGETPWEDAGRSAGALVECGTAPALWSGLELLHEAPGPTEAFRRGSLGFRWEQSPRVLVFGALGRSWRRNAGDGEHSVRVGFEYAFK